jgi:hypothetical protein
MTVANVNVTKVLFKRGNTVQNNNYTGVSGEISIDTQAKTLRIHDGVIAGGNIVTAGAMASYIPIDPTITSIQANVAAANAAISSITGIDTSLLANAATQQTQINLLNANVSAANALIPNLLAVSSNILPSANVTYSLGSESRQWKDLWVSNNTIYIGNTPLTISNGNLLVNGNLVTGSGGTVTDDVLGANVGAYQIYSNANAATQTISINSINSNVTAANSSIDIFNANLGAFQTYANLHFIDSSYSNSNVASYLPTYSGNIAANIVKNGYAWTFGANGTTQFPDETINVGTDKIDIKSSSYAELWFSAVDGDWQDHPTWNQNAYVYVQYDGLGINNVRGADGNGGATWNHTWRFDNDGGLQLPQGGKIAEGGGITGAIRLKPAGGANDNQALVIYPTAGAPEGDHVHLTAGGGSTELYLGNDYHYVKLVDGGNIELRATTANLSSQAAWTFDTTGNIDTIQALGIKVPNGVPSNVAVINSTTGSWEANPRSNLATTGGTGSGLTVNVTETGGYASTIAIATAGTGYTNGDLITVTSGSSNATFTIVIAGRNIWRFGGDGNLTLPESGYLKVGSGIVAGFASSPAPVISGFSSVSAENFRFQGNGVNILSTVGGTYSNTNVAAYLSTITSGNVGAGNLTVINNFSSNVISANSFTYANGVNILSTVAGTYGDANVATYLPTYTGNIAGNIVKNGYTWTFSNTGTTTFPTGVTLSNARGPNTVNFTTAIDKSFQIETQTSTTGRLWSFGTDGNLTLPQFANINFSNGVNILSTITAVANLSTLTGNISWTAVGANPPTFTTTSNGTKIVLWPSISSTMVDYAIGIEAGNTWFSIPQATNNFGYKWYAGNTTIATLSGNGTLTTGNITTTGSVSATNFVGNGVGLTNVTVSAAGNIVGTSSNVTLVAGNYSYTFDNTGNVTLPANVFVGVTNTFLPNTVASFSANVNYYSQVTLQNKSSGNDATADYIVTANNGSDTVNFLDLGIINSGYDNTTPSNSLGNIVFAADSYIYAQGNTSNANQSGGNLAIGTATTGKTIKFFAGGTTSSAIAMTVANTGVTVGGSITATGTFSGSGSGLTGVALKTTGSWTVTTGTGTYSFTVPASGTYQLWVDCNIPNGILAWNATATITNTNVPVVGAQYAWVYNGGGSPIDFVSIPNQFTGTGNTIVRSSVAPSANTNRFDFGLNNTSGGNVTVRYGWVAIS